MRKLTARILLIFILLSWVFISKDTLHLNVAQKAASPYLYDLLGFEISNLHSKWAHKLKTLIFNQHLSQHEKVCTLKSYVDLVTNISEIKSDIEVAASNDDVQSKATQLRLESELTSILKESEQLRDQVEEIIERLISEVLVSENLDVWKGIVLPPVDIRLTQTPKLLVTSPRGEILRTHDVLIRPNITIEQREFIENTLFSDSNLSGLVMDIGGVATFPAVLPLNQSLRWTIQTAAHEWLHHYLFFHPLGQHIFSNGEMQTLNETVADLAGREIGDHVMDLLEESVDSMLQACTDFHEGELSYDNNDPSFSFNQEMHETRLKVDNLLAEGKIKKAEKYMDERRLFFNQNGFNIRKINQAYFAFLGTYAENPASVSPIGTQVKTFRELTPSLGAFIEEIGSVSTYSQFIEKLDQLKK